MEQSQLDALLSSIRACRVCVEEFGHEPRPVVQVAPGTRLLICGQAPGRRVHESGLPFDDPSGDRLREWLGVDRRAFYADPRIGVAPMAFCFPGTNPKGGDYPPPPRCAALWRQSLVACLPKVELTVLVGAYAQRWALGDTPRRSMTETVAAWRTYGPAVIPLPHPSWRCAGWLRRNSWFENELAPYLRVRVAAILSGAITLHEPATRSR
ncbi:uracil-DNA glycosylase family protein [Mesorhizobium sp. BR1-1-3]|uniref:uracil-DNA glycosylase family protein n=1 Tax=Mesorhizobium sp. BR1-1-3 TaxID=2876651 RepID=UPI001CD0F836|nr:uracil-DNA glycosylase family protein [Mesorhizobium sp. BR1-1-3]MBZ9891511.1 uracil-DNA glycosylase family protein [Mesorhizobium sp. BR1-1-3]